MAITLGGVLLPDLVINDEISWSGIRCEISRTLDGSLLVWEQEIAGRPMTLVGRNDTAWITRRILFDVMGLAEVVGGVYVLNYEGEIYNVRFRHEDEPVISSVPVVERPNPSNNDWYSNVMIKLMEV